MYGVYAGSFDPFTNGHLEVVTHAANVFDKVVVLVADNPGKQHWFTADERRAIIADAVEGIAGAVVDVLPAGEMAVEFAYRRAACLIRGLGDFTDYPAEKTLQDVNCNLRPEVQTVFLMTRGAANQMRSSSVRQAVQYSFGWRSIRDAVPRSTFNAVVGKMIDGSFARGLGMFDVMRGVLQRYRPRPYHNFEHIAYMMDMAGMWGVEDVGIDWPVFLAAIVYHDAFVDSDSDVEAGTEIAASAELFCNDCAVLLRMPSDADRLIYATDHGKYAFGAGSDLSPGEELLVRIDLAILGETPYEYARYARSIRDEYAPKYGYLSEDFKKGRTAFLRHLLERLQFGPLINSQYDEQAAINARWELEELRQGH